MRLSVLERELLSVISKEYPKPCEPSDSQKTIAIVERNLPTCEGLKAKFKRVPAAKVSSALHRLESYQCIEKVALHAKGDFEEVNLSAGKRIRLPVARPGNGVDAYQITNFGKEVIANFPGNQLKKTLGSWGGKLLDHAFRWLIPFVLWVLFTSLFGLDLRRLWRP